MLNGRYLSLPVGLADYEVKVSEWMHWDEFLAAEAAGFKPAVEWKGRPPTSEIVEYLSGYGVYWGIHAPNNIADQAWDSWDGFLTQMEAIAKLRPAYVVIHGGLNCLIGDVPLDDPVERYKSPISADQYLCACNFQNRLLHEAVMQMNLPDFTGDGDVLLENTSITEFVGCEQLPTYCHPRAGNWTEIATLTRITTAVHCKPLCDVGHLTYGHNFFRRFEDYADLPPANEFVPASKAEVIIWNQLGLGIRQGEFPVVRDQLDLSEAIEAIDASHYHIEAGRRDSLGGEITTHAPIERDDQRMRGIIAQILRRENCLMCLEVDGSRPDGSGPFPNRAPTEELQAESWRNLCRIATELAVI